MGRKADIDSSLDIRPIPEVLCEVIFLPPSWDQMKHVTHSTPFPFDKYYNEKLLEIKFVMHVFHF